MRINKHRLTRSSTQTHAYIHMNTHTLARTHTHIYIYSNVYRQAHVYTSQITDYGVPTTVYFELLKAKKVTLDRLSQVPCQQSGNGPRIDTKKYILAQLQDSGTSTTRKRIIIIMKITSIEFSNLFSLA